MNIQDNIERNIRAAMGDLSVQLIIARSEIEALKAEIAELQTKLAEPTAPPPETKPNGAHKPSAAASPT